MLVKDYCGLKNQVSGSRNNMHRWRGRITTLGLGLRLGSSLPLPVVPQVLEMWEGLGDDVMVS